ncbi:acyloxyacyl hydrolase [Flavobacterium silvisoli]|uniref:Acyloxyacyl hydrolase n=1 Tax=Flavobacterium silvisoli TaxID=2529433 RepID=A0A4V6N0D9_9FLAO|nr:acyloxyacyl hydrolase [Flavobacterium silvisoli]TBX70559.1 acyloxyacyl hydrolase [Flavobacterium silvisoli]
MRRFCFFLLWVSGIVTAQQNDTYSLEVSALRGNVLPHKEDMYHLINGHPEGLMLSFLVKTHGQKEWHKAFNYPDYGGYFLYQDFKSQPLGVSYAAGGFYNFYFWKRRLQLRLAQGFAVVTNPYDKETNSKNKAFGTEILDNTNFGLTYTNQTLFKHLGFHAGLFFAHYSNGRVKSPNSGINTYSLNLGVNYNFSEEKAIVNDTVVVQQSYREPIRYNFVLRSGINESPIIHSGQRPFYHIGFYVDKRLNRKSALQLGTELFLTNSFKDYIKYYSVAYPEKNIAADTDYKRVGVFVGHELFINRVSLEAQVGYYVYQPFKKDIAIYDRVGMKYYATDKIFASFAVKTHMFLAEALEFGVGVRL